MNHKANGGCNEIVHCALGSEEVLLKQKGNEYMEENLHDKALCCYFRGLDINPDYVVLYSNISQAYIMMANYEAAEKFAREAIKRKQDYTKAYYRAAKAALGRKDVFVAMRYIAMGAKFCNVESMNEIFHNTSFFRKLFELFLKECNEKNITDLDGMTNLVASVDNSNVPKLHVPQTTTLKTPIIQKLKPPESKPADIGTEKPVEETQKSSIELKKELKLFMEEGSVALQKSLSRQAVGYFQKAVRIIESSTATKLGLDDVDVFLVEFALSEALILSDDYVDITKGLGRLEKMEKNGKHTKLPAIFHSLGKGFIKLNRFEHALPYLKRGLRFLEKSPALSSYSWPGTMDVIQLTNVKHLEDALKCDLLLCKCYHRPDFTCFYKDCLSLSQHILPSRFIYFSDLDFAGCVIVSCESNCHIAFHPSCWKEYKETLSEVEKLSEKDILSQNCLTPDCLNKCGKVSVIVKVVIIGSDKEEKSKYLCTPIQDKAEKENMPQIKKPQISGKKPKDNGTHVEQNKQLKSKVKIANSKPNSNSTVILQNGRFSSLHSETEEKKKNNDNIFSFLESGDFIPIFFEEIVKRCGCLPITELKECWEKLQNMLPSFVIGLSELIEILLASNRFIKIDDNIALSPDPGVCNMNFSVPKFKLVADSQTDRTSEASFENSNIWKPRPKLLAWAMAEFPSETPSTIAYALRFVRAKNNNTLSGLPFDVIKDRVHEELLHLNS